MKDNAGKKLLLQHRRLQTFFKTFGDPLVIIISSSKSQSKSQKQQPNVIDRFKRGKRRPGEKKKVSVKTNKKKEEGKRPGKTLKA